MRRAPPWRIIAPMVTPSITQNVLNRAEELSGVERETLEGAISETIVFRSAYVVVAAGLALAFALTALVALAGLVAVV
jgi:hypothetical protein